MPLFERVSYHISQSLPAHPRREIARMLDANGATEVALDRATHVVSDTIELEGCDTLQEGVACVSPYWVERSMELGQLQDPKYFSADKNQIFSGVVATSADIPPGDKEVIAAAIIEQGGGWREGLTRDVTHLFVTNTRSEKYQTAMHFRDSAHITVLLPQWFDQCWSAQARLPPDVFMFPDPPYLNKDHDGAAYKAQMVVKKNAADSPHLGDRANKGAIFRAMQTEELSSPAPAARDIWQGRAILLSSSLGLDTPRRESVETRINRAGGRIVVVQVEEESTAVERADVLVTRFRTGAAYAKALAEGKTIGTLAWLFYVERTGVVSRPRDQLLHYPVRSRPIAGFSDHVITVTNYQGDEREYIKKLIHIMGAKFTPTMSGRNTIVIAAYKGGNKTDKADEWSVPIVTHKWLEDCFVEWRNLTPAQKKYVDYAPGVNYGTVLGERGVGRVGLEEDPELPPVNGKEAAREGVDAVMPEELVEKKNPESKEGDGVGLTATGTSAREAREAAEVEDALDLGGDPDEDPEDARDAPVFTPTKVGPPRGIKKIPAKKDIEPATVAVKPKPRPKPTSTGVAAGDKRVHDGMAPPRKEKPASKNAVLAGEESGDESSGMAKIKAPSRTRVDDEINNAAGSAPKKADMAANQKPKPKLTSSKKPAAPRASEEELLKEQEPPAKLKTKSLPRPDEKNATGGPSMTIVMNAKPKPKPSSSKKSAPADESEEVEEKEGPEPRGVVKGKPRTAQTTRADEDEDAPKPKHRPKAKVPVKNRARESTPIMVDSDDKETSGVDETPPRVKSKPSPKTYKSKAKVQTKAAAPTSESESENDDDVQEIPPKKGAAAGKTFGAMYKGKSKAPAQRIVPSPNRIVSVDLPDPRSLINSISARIRPRTPDNIGYGSKRTPSPARVPQGKPLARTTSVRVAAYEAPAPSPKRGRPSARHDTVSRSPSLLPRHSPIRPTSSSRAAAKPNARKTPSSASGASSPPPLPLQRTPSRRSAAAAATQKLRDEVMPDVINYQNERRRGTREKGSTRRKNLQLKGYDEDESEDEESEGETRRKKRPKVGRDDGPSGKGKNKAARKHETDDSDPPPERFVTHVKNGKRPAPASDDEPGPSKRPGGSGARKKVRIEISVSEDGSDDEAGPGRSSWDPKKIRILTTKIEVSPEVTDTLVKLGMKFIQKPAECTHLVASSFARTEKFLCALSNAPFVLNKDWLTACAEAKKVVGEKAYFLKDPDTEYKHKFKLADALRRARELKKKNVKLLQGQFFYFTANVPLDFTLVKNVLQTNGAECMKSAPTIRNISSTRHVVSCLKDEKIWRPLANNGVAIYSHELVLMAALAQYVDWDGEDMRVPGSI